MRFWRDREPVRDCRGAESLPRCAKRIGLSAVEDGTWNNLPRQGMIIHERDHDRRWIRCHRCALPFTPIGVHSVRHPTGIRASVSQARSSCIVADIDGRCRILRQARAADLAAAAVAWPGRRGRTPRVPVAPRSPAAHRTASGGSFARGRRSLLAPERSSSGPRSVQFLSGGDRSAGLHLTTAMKFWRGVSPFEWPKT